MIIILNEQHVVGCVAELAWMQSGTGNYCGIVSGDVMSRGRLLGGGMFRGNCLDWECIGECVGRNCPRRNV